MARKNYPDEFKGDAVALYRDTDGATITAIALLRSGSARRRCRRGARPLAWRSGT
jgi:transposase-like protein